MSVAIVFLCLAIVIGIYFYNNPLRHGRWFLSRRFINWFPLGMTYSFLYMGRYNLTVAKNAFGSRMSNEEFGLIFAAGTLTYALSFLVNGPLVDKIGGKRGMLIAAIGAAAANVAFPIIKVKAHWFHVRERGVFGAIFGTLISFGVYFAFDWGQAIINMTKVQPPAVSSGLSLLVRRLFMIPGQAVDATWAVFFIPAAILVVWAVLDVWLIKDTPELAGFPASPSSTRTTLPPASCTSNTAPAILLKRVFLNPLMLMFAFIELTSGVLRIGIMQWHTSSGTK